MVQNDTVITDVVIHGLDIVLSLVNPVKLEIPNLISAVREAEMEPPLKPHEEEFLRPLAGAPEIARMIGEGQRESAWPEALTWSARSA